MLFKYDDHLNHIDNLLPEEIQGTDRRKKALYDAVDFKQSYQFLRYECSCVQISLIVDTHHLKYASAATFTAAR
jgi:hypothetical protein